MTEIHAFVDAQDVKTITAPFFKQGEEVVIKRFSYADRQMLSGEYLRIKSSWQAKEGRRDEIPMESEFLLDRMNLAILERGIKSWTLQDRDGKIVSCNKQNIGKLSEPYAEFILQEINEFNPVRTTEEREEFFRGTGDSAQE